MSRIEVIPFGPSDGSDGHAFGIYRDDEPVVLLDAGAPRDARPVWIPEAIEHTAVWISHGHHDHAGGLPPLLQENPTIDVVLPAKAVSAAVAVATAGGLDASRAHAIFDNARAVKFHTEFELGSTRAIAGPSGHGVGAGLLRVECDTVRIGYTGDWALHPRSSTEPAALDILSNLDLLVCEAALCGASRLDEWSSMETISEITHYIDHDGPRLLVASPFGELSELLALVRHRDDVMVEKGLASFAEGLPTGDLRTCARHLDGGGLVIAHGSDLHANSPAGELAIPHVTGPNARIALFNGVPRGTPASELLATRRRDRRTIYGKNRRIRAHVRHFDLPTHATRPDLIRALLHIAPRHLVLFHQSKAALADFAKALEDAGFTGKISIAQLGVGVVA